MKLCSVLLVSVVALALGACGKKQPEEGAANASGSPLAVAPSIDEAALEAKQVYGTICVSCHGPTGKGDGAAAGVLSVKPRDYTDKGWQAGITDEELRKIILLGGQAVGKSPLMPGQAHLKDKPAVVDALVAMIRAFGK